MAKKPQPPSVNQTAIGNDNIQVVGSNNVITRITNFFAGDTEQQRAMRNRRAMLELVKNTWIKGVLEKSLYNEVLIDLGMEERLGEVDHPWDMQIQMPNKANRTLPAGTAMMDVFDEMNGAMLILGEPGSGKTTMLLELARDCIARAEQDETQPIPVIFNLSSWSDKQTIDDWLLNELRTKYNVPKKAAQNWVENGDLQLLLDGLDEVKLENREACVKAINEFRQKHGLTMPITVCSRIADYEALTAKLSLTGAVLLQHLTPQQIDKYFEQAGSELEGVHQILQNDDVLQELVKQPLMLSVITLAYQGATAEIFSGENLGTIETRRTHIFETYAQQMFERVARTKNELYTPEQTRYWLAWLAQKMIEHNSAPVLLEDMQPTWISQRKQRLFGLIFGLIFGIWGGLIGMLSVVLIISLMIGGEFAEIVNIGSIGGLIGGLFSGLIFGLRGGLVGGLITGPICGLMFGLLYALFGELNFVDRVDAIRLIGLNGLIGLISGLIGGLIGGLGGEFRENNGLVTSVWDRRKRLIGGLGVALGIILILRLVNSIIQWLVGLGFGLVPSGERISEPFLLLMNIGFIMSQPMVALIFGLIGGLISVQGGGLHEIKLVDTFTWDWKKGLSFVLCGGLIGGLISGPIFGWVIGRIGNWLIYGQIGLGCGLITGLIFGLIGGLRAKLFEETIYPGQRIAFSIRNFFFVFLSSLLIVGLIGGLRVWVTAEMIGVGPVLLSGPKYIGVVFLENLNFGLIVVMAFGLVGGFKLGGGAVIQHYILRIIIAFNKLLPLRLVRFLDYCVDRIFLRRVGGGYIFVHRLLMEHFAEMYPVSDK